MKVIELNESAVEACLKKRFPTKRMTPYRWDVLVNGDIPGVLSGADLQGKAKNYRLRYLESAAVSHCIAKDLANVEEDLVLVEYTPGKPRHSKVWTDIDTGEPVKIHINWDK